MWRRAVLILVLALPGCAEHWQNIASGAREQALACNEAKANGDSWGVFSHCGRAADVPLPPECMVSDDAARTPKCVAIAKGEALSGSVDSAAMAGVITGAAFSH